MSQSIRFYESSQKLDWKPNIRVLHTEVQLPCAGLLIPRDV